MTTVTVIERRHGGHGAIFELDSQRYYVPMCCNKAEVEITDEDARQCQTICPNHSTVMRTYDAALTDSDRSTLDAQLSSSSAFNPASDPHGTKAQRRRKSGTTYRWYDARGM